MGIESRASFTITANLGKFPTGSVHGGNEICPDQWFGLPELSLHLQILGFFSVKKLGDDRPLDLLKFLGPHIYVNDRWS